MERKREREREDISRGRMRATDYTVVEVVREDEDVGVVGLGLGED